VEYCYRPQNNELSHNFINLFELIYFREVKGIVFGRFVMPQGKVEKKIEEIRSQQRNQVSNSIFHPLYEARPVI
jgi:muramoyltetrapeptide carboxypeptidase LdcA involved in peptidoglycan recycling